MRVLGMGLVAACLLAAPALASGKSKESWNQVWTSDSSVKDFAYGLVEPTAKGGSLVMYGRESDRDDVLRESKRVSGPFVWIRTGSERWLIKDAAAIAQAKAILEPVLALDREQSRLGDLQSEIGDTQSKIGDMQSEIGDRQSEIGDRQAALSEKAIDASAGGSRQQAYEREQEALAQDQAELGRAQARLGEKQAQVGRDQAKLGAEQDKFGAHRKEVEASVRTGMKSWLSTARTTGKATKL